MCESFYLGFVEIEINEYDIITAQINAMTAWKIKDQI